VIARDASNFSAERTDEERRPACGQHAVELAGNDAVLEFRQQRHKMSIRDAQALRQHADRLQRLENDVLEPAALHLRLDHLALLSVAHHQEMYVALVAQPVRRFEQRREIVRTPEIAGVANDELVPDRKSTRLNSSHVKISYAVFCLKKKK